MEIKIITIGSGKKLIGKSWPYLAIILSHLIWGVNFIMAKLTLQEIPLMSLALLRFILAIILLLPFLIMEKNKLKIDRVDLPKLFAVGVFMITLNIAFFYAGLERTTVISASVLTMTIPVTSILIGWWFLKEKIYTVNLMGVFLGLVGAIFVIGLPTTLLGLQPITNNLLGNFLIILASISWVVGATISKEMLKKYPTLIITATIFLVGIITFAIPAILEYLQNPLWPTKITYIGISGLIFIAVASSVSAYFLFEWGLSKLGVIKADLFQYIEPLIATTLGVLVLHEGLRFSAIIGAILIGLGVYWATLAQNQHKHHKAHRT